MPKNESIKSNAGSIVCKGKRMGMMRRIISFVVSNIPLIVAALLYLFCMTFVVREMHDHGKLFGLTEYDLIEPEPHDTETFSFVLLVMGVSGFMLIIIVCGSTLNLSRLMCDREKQWQLSVSHLKAIESAADGIAILDANGQYIYANTAHAVYYGYIKGSDLIGLHWRELYTPARALWFQSEVFTHLERYGEWAGQSFGLKQDGTEFPQEVTLKSLVDGGIICTVRDLSEKFKNDQLMRIIKLAVEAAADGIAITDENNKLLFMNKSFLKIHGYDPYEWEKYIGTDWRLLYNAAGQEQINYSVLPATILKGIWSGSVTVMKKDGTLFYGDASLTRLPDGLVLGVMRDISDRRQAEMEREELKEQIFRSEKIEAIGRLTNRFIMDFKNILRTVDRAAQALGSEDLTNERRKNYAFEITEEAKRAQLIVDQLLAFSQDKKTKTSVVDLYETLLALQESIRSLLPENVAFMTDLKTKSASVFFGEDQIRQIIKNICVNGFEAIGRNPGKVTITLKDMDGNLFGLRQYMIADYRPDKMKATNTRIKPVQGRHYLMTGFLLNDRNYVQLDISDTGSGIQPDILGSIFDPFFTTKQSSKGAGLGLSTVQGGVVNNGGAIIVETMPDQGTIVHLFFPKADAGQSVAIPAA